MNEERVPVRVFSLKLTIVVYMVRVNLTTNQKAAQINKYDRFKVLPACFTGQPESINRGWFWIFRQVGPGDWSIYELHLQCRQDFSNFMGKRNWFQLSEVQVLGGLITVFDWGREVCFGWNLIGWSRTRNQNSPVVCLDTIDRENPLIFGNSEIFCIEKQMSRLEPLLFFEILTKNINRLKWLEEKPVQL